MAELAKEARSCTACPSMPGCPSAYGPTHGSLGARCLVIGEAPGKHGAWKTGVPFSGDRTGDSFEALLAGAEITREQLFITNAVLCAPPEKGPGKAEVERCSRHLSRLISILDPTLVVTLGQTALTATQFVAPHGLVLRWSAGEPHRWLGRFLLPLYHPGARSRIKRSLAEQQRDWKLIGELLRA